MFQKSLLHPRFGDSPGLSDAAGTHPLPLDGWMAWTVDGWDGKGALVFAGKKRRHAHPPRGVSSPEVCPETPPRGLLQRTQRAAKRYLVFCCAWLTPSGASSSAILLSRPLTRWLLVFLAARRQAIPITQSVASVLCLLLKCVPAADMCSHLNVGSVDGPVAAKRQLGRWSYLRCQSPLLYIARQIVQR